MALLLLTFLLLLTATTLPNNNILASELKPDFYKVHCPQVEKVVTSALTTLLARDQTLAASLVRLHFHDCFVQGCDGSILLDNSEKISSEKNSPPNKNSVRGYDVIDQIKANLEEVCPQTVSCADIVALVARDSVSLTGGPAWKVKLGRKDGLTADAKGAVEKLPAPSFGLPKLLKSFAEQGMDADDLVALSGAHTLGSGKCIFYAGKKSSVCPVRSNNFTSPLDERTPTLFDNMFFVNLMSGEGFFGSDQALLGNDTLALVKQFAADKASFFHQFSLSMVKLGSLGGTVGEIRTNCRRPN